MRVLRYIGVSMFVFGGAWWVLGLAMRWATVGDLFAVLSCAVLIGALGAWLAVARWVLPILGLLSPYLVRLMAGHPGLTLFGEAEATAVGAACFALCAWIVEVITRRLRDDDDVRARYRRRA